MEEEGEYFVVKAVVFDSSVVGAEGDAGEVAKERWECGPEMWRCVCGCIFHLFGAVVVVDGGCE